MVRLDLHGLFVMALNPVGFQLFSGIFPFAKSFSSLGPIKIHEDLRQKFHEISTATCRQIDTPEIRNTV